MNWYLVKYNSVKVELVVKLMKRKYGTDNVFMPTYELKHIKGTTTRTVRKPAFPGYLFVMTHNPALVDVELREDYYGRVSLIRSTEGNFYPLPKEDISRLSGLEFEDSVNPKYEEGMLVRMFQGPFSHFTGKIKQVLDRSVVLEVIIFNQLVPVTVDLNSIERV